MKKLTEPGSIPGSVSFFIQPKKLFFFFVFRRFFSCRIIAIGTSS